MKSLKYLFLICLLALFSCKKDNGSNDPQNGSHISAVVGQFLWVAKSPVGVQGMEGSLERISIGDNSIIGSSTGPNLIFSIIENGNNYILFDASYIDDFGNEYIFNPSIYPDFQLIITENDETERKISGNFYFTLHQIMNTSQTLLVENGKFDINY